MKSVKTLFKELLPIIISMAVWIINIRPMTWALQHVDPLLKVPLNVNESTRTGWDIGLLAAAVAVARTLFHWPRYLTLQGRMVNAYTLAPRTYLVPTEDDPGEPELIRLAIKVNLRTRRFLRLLQSLGGVALVIRRPSKTFTLQLDARHAADRSYFHRTVQGWPAIRFTDVLDDRPADLDLDYTISALANGLSTQTGTIRVDICPLLESGWQQQLARAAIKLFVASTVVEHTMHIQPRRRG